MKTLFLLFITLFSYSSLAKTEFKVELDCRGNSLSLVAVSFIKYDCVREELVLPFTLRLVRLLLLLLFRPRNVKVRILTHDSREGREGRCAKMGPKGE